MQDLKASFAKIHLKERSLGAAKTPLLGMMWDKIPQKATELHKELLKAKKKKKMWNSVLSYVGTVYTFLFSWE